MSRRSRTPAHLDSSLSTHGSMPSAETCSSSEESYHPSTNLALESLGPPGEHPHRRSHQMESGPSTREPAVPRRELQREASHLTREALRRAELPPPRSASALDDSISSWAVSSLTPSDAFPRGHKRSRALTGEPAGPSSSLWDAYHTPDSLSYGRDRSTRGPGAHPGEGELPPFSRSSRLHLCRACLPCWRRTPRRPLQPRPPTGSLRSTSGPHRPS